MHVLPANHAGAGLCVRLHLAGVTAAAVMAALPAGLLHHTLDDELLQSQQAPHSGTSQNTVKT